MDWKIAVGGGVVLGVLVVIWQFVAAAAGLNAIFPLVATLIELIVLLGGMAQTRHTQGYGAQAASGSVMAAVSCVLILPGAILVGAAVPDMIAGVVGTLVTGVVVALIAAIFLRAKA